MMISSKGTEKIGRHKVLLKQDEKLILINVIIKEMTKEAENDPKNTGVLTILAENWIKDPDVYPQPITLE